MFVLNWNILTEVCILVAEHELQSTSFSKLTGSEELESWNVAQFCK